MSLSSRRKSSGKKQTLEENVKDLITATLILGIMSSIGPHVLSQLEPKSKPITKWFYILLIFICCLVVFFVLVYTRRLI